MDYVKLELNMSANHRKYPNYFVKTLRYGAWFSAKSSRSCFAPIGDLSASINARFTSKPSIIDQIHIINVWVMCVVKHLKTSNRVISAISQQSTISTIVTG
jgi:hypothetical protein